MHCLYVNIKRIRKEMGYRQDDIADKMGYRSKAMISKIEHGEIDLPFSKVEALAKILNTPVTELISPYKVSSSETEKDENGICTSSLSIANMNHKDIFLSQDKEAFLSFLDSIRKMSDEQWRDMERYASYLLSSQDKE